MKKLLITLWLLMVASFVYAQPDQIRTKRLILEDSPSCSQTLTCLTDFSGGGGSDLGVFNVKDILYGATGDGATDDTTAIAAAITAAAINGGAVYFPAGTYIVSGLTMASGVYLAADGATIKLKSSSNAHLLDFTDVAGSGILGTLTLDGNKAGQGVAALDLKANIFISGAASDLYFDHVISDNAPMDGF
jgi:hypothetical protein